MPYPTRPREISRQFTDSERAVDERISSHLQAPPLQLTIGNDIGQTYKWLREDMKLRSEYAGQLQNEQAMAYTQSSRHALAKQAVDQEAEDAEAVSALSSISESVKNGTHPDMESAISNAYSTNPNLWLNRTFGASLASSKEYFKSDEDRDFEDLKRTNERLKISSENFSLEEANKFRDENPQAFRNALAAAAKQNEVALSTGDLTIAKNNTAKLQALEDHRSALEAMENFKQTGLRPEDYKNNSMAMARLMDLGIENPDIPALNRAFPALNDKEANPTMEMIHSPWFARNKPEEFTKDLSAITNPETPEQERRAARTRVMAVTGKYLNDVGSVAEYQRQRDDLLESTKDWPITFTALSDDIQKIVPKEGETDKDAVSSIAGLARNFFAQDTTGAGDEYIGYIDQLTKEAEAGNWNAGKMRSKVFELSSKFQNARKESLTRVAPNDQKASESSEKSTDYPRVANDDDFNSLPSGAKFIDPNGKLRTKP